MRKGTIMREVSSDEQKKVLLDILIDIDRVCRENDIGYSIAYGTLLGAVRHGGFIPWDDDIDIIVTREDYTKMKRIMNDKLNDDHYFVCVEDEKRFSAPLAKVIDKNTVLVQQGHYSDRMDLGIYIDIFTYDFIPNDLEKRNKVYKKSVFLQNLWTFAGNNTDNYNKLIRFARSIANKTSIARRTALYMHKWAEKLDHDSDLMSPLTYGNLVRERDLMEYRDLVDLAEYKFEGHKFLGIRDYDKYLTLWYGDYMNLPPENERVSGHDTLVYWKE